MPISRYIPPSALPQLASYTQAVMTTATPTAWTTANTGFTLFTVTGDVLVQLWGEVTTGITSTGGTGTLSVGVTGDTACLIPIVTADGSNLPTGSVWTDTSPTTKASPLGDSYAAVAIKNTNILAAIATNDMTAGGIIIYCRWIPISAGATVVSAA